MNEDEFAINERKIDKLDSSESIKLDLRVKNYIAHQLTRIATVLEGISEYRAHLESMKPSKDIKP